MLQERNTSLWEAVKNWAKDVAGKIQAIVDAHKDERMDSREGRIIANMKEILPQLEELYAEGLADSRVEAATDSDAGTKKAAGDGGVQVRYSLKDYSQHQKENWENSKRIVLYKNVEQYKSFIQNAFHGKPQTNKKMYFGSIPSDMADDIKKATGINVDGYNLSISENEIRKINKSHGNDKTEQPRGQRAVTESDYLNIPNVVQSPDRITLSLDKYEGKPAIEFRKMNGNETTTVVAVVSDKRLDLFVQTSYVNKKTGSIATPEPVQADSFTSETPGGTAPTSTISQNDPGVKMHSDRDSNGTQLSKEQVDYFRNSKVRDEEGNLLVMYHGTPNGGFTKFRSGSYFTQNPEYAALYQNPGASMLSHKKGADNPQSYQVYLNIEKPFDTRNPKERRIFMQEYYRKYGTGAPLSDSGLPDWTDGMDLQEFIEDMGYDYDGLILDEGATGGYGDEVKSRGLSYVTFNPEQVKDVKNTTPTANPDYRFSDRDPVAVKVNQLLQKQNAELRETVGYLKELVKLQGKVTDGTVYFDIAEIALSALGRQYIANNRISDLPSLRSLLEPWAVARNFAQKGVDWHLTTDDARTKLKHLYVFPDTFL